jgi:hypothetical protein
LIHAALVPELAGSLGRVDAGILPLRGFIASGGLQLPAAVVASEKQIFGANQQVPQRDKFADSASDAVSAH